MKRLDELKAELAVTSKQLAALAAKDEPTEAELEQFKSLEAVAADLNTEIETEETKAAEIARRREVAASYAPKTVTVPTGDDVHISNEKAVTTSHDNVTDDPQMGYKHAGDFYADVHAAGISGGAMSENLRRIQATIGTDEQSTFDNGMGGFLTMPPQYANDLLQITAEADVLAGLTTSIAMGAPEFRVNARVDKDHSTSVSGGSVAYWQGEANPITTSRSKVEQIKMEAAKLTGAVYVTDELLERSTISIPSFIEANFRDEFISKRMAARLRGTGVGQPTGIIKHAGSLNIQRGTANTVVYADLVNMVVRHWSTGGAVWVANKSVMPQLMVLKDANNNYLFVMDASENLKSTLFGIPIIFTEHASALGTQGDIMLCNWSQYLEGTYGSMTSASSIHVRFLEGEQTFKFVEHRAGLPWWSSVLTPINGSTESPFVILDDPAA